MSEVHTSCKLNAVKLQKYSTCKEILTSVPKSVHVCYERGSAGVYATKTLFPSVIVIAFLSSLSLPLQLTPPLLLLLLLLLTIYSYYY